MPRTSCVQIDLIRSSSSSSKALCSLPGVNALHTHIQAFVSSISEVMRSWSLHLFEIPANQTGRCGGAPAFRLIPAAASLLLRHNTSASVTHSVVPTGAHLSASLTQRRRLDCNDSDELRWFLGTLLFWPGLWLRRSTDAAVVLAVPSKPLFTAAPGAAAFVRRRVGAQRCGIILKLLYILQRREVGT